MKPQIKQKTTAPKKLRRGFACMTPEKRAEIARMGGLTISRNRRHMCAIGRVGGSSRQKNYKTVPRRPAAR